MQSIHVDPLQKPRLMKAPPFLNTIIAWIFGLAKQQQKYKHSQKTMCLCQISQTNPTPQIEQTHDQQQRKRERNRKGKANVCWLNIFRHLHAEIERQTFQIRQIMIFQSLMNINTYCGLFKFLVENSLMEDHNLSSTLQTQIGTNNLEGAGQCEQNQHYQQSLQKNMSRPINFDNITNLQIFHSTQKVSPQTVENNIHPISRDDSSFKRSTFGYNHHRNLPSKNQQLAGQQLSSQKTDIILDKSNQKIIIRKTKAHPAELHVKRRHVILHIIKIVDRNQTYKCSYAHFLVPYALSLLTVIVIDRSQQTYLFSIFIIVVKKINRPNIKNQIKKESFERCMTVFLNYKKVSYEQIICCLRTFLEIEGEIAKALCPYYYNFFAFFVNKDIVFGGNHQIPLLEYTIQFKHQMFNENFKSNEVLVQVEKLQQLLWNTYHSNEI